MLIFSFFGQKSRVNNLAMVGSITWPSFWPKFCPERWPSYWPYSFHAFFVKTCFFFFKNLILPAERRRFLKNQKTQQKKIKKKTDGQVIDLWWPSYWPYSIYMYITLWDKLITKMIPWELFSLFLRDFMFSKCPGIKDTLKDFTREIRNFPENNDFGVIILCQRVFFSFGFFFCFFLWGGGG